jgi:hypothetical protein
VRATTAFVRLLVRGIAWDAGESGVPFADALRTAARARLTDTSRGKVLVGTTSGGTAVTYALPPLGTLTSEDLAEACSILLDRCDAIRAGQPAVTDEALVATLLSQLKPVHAFGHDFRGYRP